jgi:hypothetical protein
MTSKKKKLNKKKLAKILGMLGSDQPGERESAVEQAIAMLKDTGRTWYEALGIDEASASEQEEAQWSDVDAELAADIFEREDVLDAFIREWRKVMAGEEQNAKILYLACTSRLLDKCINVAIKGPSSAGKSEIRKQVTAFFPDEGVISFTSMSERALIYREDDYDHKILSMGEASGAEEQSLQDYFLRELMSAGQIRYDMVDKYTMRTKTIIKNGPVAFMVTTTKASLHPENETRMLSLEVDDTAAQTARVMRKVAANIGMNAEKHAIDYLPWHAFQRWLEIGNCKVVVPYADTLSTMIPPKAVRLRRDLAQVLLAIKSHALLHRRHREVDERDQIVADIYLDYCAIYKIMGNLMAEASGVRIKPEVSETIDAVRIETANMDHAEGATAYMIGKRLNLDKSAARRRLIVAKDDGFIVNLETRRGQPGRWRVIAEQADAAEGVMLPRPEALASKFYSTLTPPPKPCHHTEKGKDNQSDNGGKNGGDASCHRPVVDEPSVADEPVASPETTAHATANQLEINGKEPPVARFHGWQGGEGGETGTPHPDYGHDEFSAVRKRR